MTFEIGVACSREAQTCPHSRLSIAASREHAGFGRELDSTELAEVSRTARARACHPEMTISAAGDQLGTALWLLRLQIEVRGLGPIGRHGERQLRFIVVANGDNFSYLRGATLDHV